GFSAPQVLENVSSSRLQTLAQGTAKELKIPLSQAKVTEADADSSSFIARKIPAVTIHGLNNDWPKILHSNNDQVSQIHPLSVFLGYRLIVSMLVRLDTASCVRYR